MRRISIKGVVIGGIADIVATNIAAVPVLAYTATQIDLLHIPESEQTRALMAFLRATAVLYILLSLLGALWSVLGGYVAAILAKRAEILNGALSAFLCVGLGIWTLVVGAEQMPVWLHVLLLPLSPALGALGGYLRHLQTSGRRPQNVTSVPSGAA